jgi:hypothetical protein
LNVQQLCAYKQPDTEADPEPRAHVILWPQVCRHLFHNGPIRLALLLVGQDLLLKQWIRLCDFGSGGVGGRFGDFNGKLGAWLWPLTVRIFSV